jgi:predicted PurR-regulated permease PerM
VIIVDGAAVLAMALYLAWRPAAYVEGLVAVVPPRHRPLARAIAADLGATLKAWVGAQLLAMILLAIATGIGLWLLDVPYWLAFAIFTGVAVMVPFFGSITSTILPALLVLPDRGVVAALAVAMVGVIVHVIEANIVHPLIMERRVALPPALTILSVLAMGALAGLLGMVVAVPTLALVIVLVRHIVVRQAYGEVPLADLAAEPGPPVAPGPTPS